MALYDHNTGKWKSDSGGEFDDRGSAMARDAANAQEKSSSGGGGKGGGGGLGILVILYYTIPFAVMIIASFLAAAVTILNFLIQLPLYILMIGIAVFAFLFIRRILPIPILNTLLGLVAMVAIGIFGFMGTTKLYDLILTKNVYVSQYSVDYIGPLPDEYRYLYSKRYQKGEILGTLEVGEKVKVNGIDFADKNFNITRADGTTGWVIGRAFPQDAAVKIHFSRGADAIGEDRSVERFVKKYQEGTVSMNMDFFSLPSVPINTQTPYFFVSGRDLVSGKAKLARTGDMVTLENIMYLDEFTILSIAAVRSKQDKKPGSLYNLSSAYHSNPIEWYDSLTLTDLDTGEKWKRLSSARREELIDTTTGEKVGREKWNNLATAGTRYGMWIIFPPIKSKHFSLTHEGVKPIPPKPKKKHNYIDWNFTQVQVEAIK